jgi:putative membrane protein
MLLLAGKFLPALIYFILNKLIVSNVINQTQILKEQTMKKLNVLFLAGFTALSFQACNSSSKTNSSDMAKDSNSTKDTSSSMKSTTDTTAKTAGAVMKVDKDDADFAVKAANGGMAEVAMGKLAQQKGVSQEVKDFGAKMVTDHTKANDKMMALAKQKNITLPSAVSNDEQKKMDDMSKKTGKDFDKAYVKEMVDDHDKDVKDFEKEAKDGKDADVKAFAAATLPVLKMHQTMIKAIDKKM